MRFEHKQRTIPSVTRESVNEMDHRSLTKWRKQMVSHSKGTLVGELETTFQGHILSICPLCATVSGKEWTFRTQPSIEQRILDTNAGKQQS